MKIAVPNPDNSPIVFSRFLLFLIVNLFYLFRCDIYLFIPSENYIISFSLCLVQITELLNLKQDVMQNIRKVW